jgi:sigma-B regulation protein RsbU (phosphoserine phosphatase)
VEVLGDLASRRRHIGLVVLSGKEGQIALEREELRLLQQLLQQAALALETNLLLEERTRRAELEREMEIAATIQAQLLPTELTFAGGWSIAAACRPARIVGGDFYTQLGDGDGRQAVIFGDVCGKSVAGALMMMAAHEAVHALALTAHDPATLFELTNRRLYALGKRNFVALGYFAACANGERLRYVIAGQPPPLLRRSDGTIEPLPLPDHRIPVGALKISDYRALEVPLAPGELVLGYSDGLLDARSPDGEGFGEERLFRAVSEGPEDPERLVEWILEAIDTFTEGGIQYDDMTLVAVKRPGGDP